MIEKEMKILLDEQQYEELYGKFVWEEKRIQVNHYYVDDELMKSKDITIRVREYNDNYLLQIKIPLKEEGSTHIKKEIEVILDSVPDVINGEYLTNLCGIEFQDVKKVGCLITERNICNWNAENEISLDKNCYLGYEDFEIEIEYLNTIDIKLFEILNECQINTDGSVKGKCRRFFERYKIVHNISDII